MHFDLSASEAATIRCLVRAEMKKSENLSKRSYGNDEYWKDRAKHYKKILSSLGAAK